MENAEKNKRQTVAPEVFPLELDGDKLTVFASETVTIEDPDYAAKFYPVTFNRK